MAPYRHGMSESAITLYTRKWVNP